MHLVWRVALLIIQIGLLAVLARGELDFVYQAF
jgi:hypothetical protein